MQLGMANKKLEDFSEYSPATSRSSSVKPSEGSTTSSPIKPVTVNVDVEPERPMTMHEWAEWVPEGWTLEQFQEALDNELGIGNEPHAESSTMAQNRSSNR
jgi:hypothetical protein